MKKKRLIFSILIVFFIFSTIKLITALASENSIIITGMEVIDKSDEVKVNSCSFDETSIFLDVDFHNLDDFLTYKIILKNNDTLDYKIKSISDNNESEYINYQFDYSEDEFEAKGTKEIFVTIKYEKEIEEIVDRINNESISIELILEDEDENEKEENINVIPGNNTSDNTNRTTENTNRATGNTNRTTENTNTITGNTNTSSHKTNNITNNESIIVAESSNPKTGDDIRVYFISELLALILLVTFVRKNKELQKTKKSKSGKHSKGTKLFGLIIFGLLVLPSVVKAGTNTIVITNKASLNLYDKLVVSYDVNGEVKKEIIKYNTKLGEPDTVNLDGYEFKGWYTEPNGGEKITGETVITEDITFYAQFDIINYDITYNLNGGEVTNPTSYTVEDKIVLNNPQKQGYTFSGWTGSNGDNLQTQVTINKGTTGNKEYVANYSANTNTQYKVIHKKMDINGENYIESDVDYLEGATDTTVTPEVKDYEGFTPPTEQNLVITGDGKAELIYEYTRNQYNLKYENTEYIDLTLSTPAGDYYYGKTITAIAKDKEGYYFTGWSNGEITKEISFEIEDHITLKPNYKANNYQVIFSANGGTGEMDNQTLTYDESSKLNASTFTKQGYTFKNWNTKEDGQGTTYADEANVTNLAKEGSITLYAQYTPNTNTAYTVVHELMDINCTTYTVKETENLQGTTDTTVTPEVKSYEGFTSPTAQSLVITADGEAKITYQYIRNKYTVQFNANGGTGEMENQECIYGKEEVLNENTFTKSNVKFDSWNTKADGKGTKYNDKASIKNLVTEGSITLYAQWKIEQNENTDGTKLKSVSTFKSTVGSTQFSNITAFLRSDTLPSAGVQTYEIADTGSITGWYDGTKFYWYSETEHPLLDSDMGRFFDGCKQLTDISGLEDFDAKNVKYMQYLFNNTSINSLEALKKWKVENVERLEFAFKSPQITSLEGINTWNISKVGSLEQTFNNTLITDVTPLKNWDVSNVANFDGLFSGSDLRNLNGLESWNVAKATTMQQTFHNNKNLTDINAIKNWNVSNLQNARGLFQNLKGLTSLEAIKDWNVSNLTSMQQMFAADTNITNLEALSNWNVEKVTNFNAVFDACGGITSLKGLENWDVSTGTNFTGMFYNVKLLTIEGAEQINNWKLRKTATFTNMFRNVNNKPTFTFDINGVEKAGTWDSNGTLIVPTE